MKHNGKGFSSRIKEYCIYTEQPLFEPQEAAISKKETIARLIQHLLGCQ